MTMQASYLMVMTWEIFSDSSTRSLRGQNVKLNPGLFGRLLCTGADVNEIVKVRTGKNKRNLLAAQISRSGRIGTGFSRGRCGGRRWSHLFCLGRGGAASQTAERECRNQGNRKNMNKAFFHFSSSWILKFGIGSLERHRVKTRRNDPFMNQQKKPAEPLRCCTGSGIRKTKRFVLRITKKALFLRRYAKSN